jgi:hypothetical protein
MKAGGEKSIEKMTYENRDHLQRLEEHAKDCSKIAWVVHDKSVLVRKVLDNIKHLRSLSDTQISALHKRKIEFWGGYGVDSEHEIVVKLDEVYSKFSNGVRNGSRKVPYHGVVKKIEERTLTQEEYEHIMQTPTAILAKELDPTIGKYLFNYPDVLNYD